MTSRQGIEIPFIKVEDINEVKEKSLQKVESEQVSVDPRVRTITACQDAAICQVAALILIHWQRN